MSALDLHYGFPRNSATCISSQKKQYKMEDLKTDTKQILDFLGFFCTVLRQRFTHQGLCCDMIKLNLHECG